MKAHARLTACFDGSRTVLRELRSMAPLTLFPRRRSGSTAVVHLVNSATSPLGGDDLLLSVHVGPGASLRLSGVAATLALPGLHGESSLSTVDVVVEPGGSLEYLPEPTVVTARARHNAVFRASVASDAYLHTREVLVLGGPGKRPVRCRLRCPSRGVPCRWCGRRFRWGMRAWTGAWRCWRGGGCWPRISWWVARSCRRRRVSGGPAAPSLRAAPSPLLLRRTPSRP
ncbi:urease accessory protein UreD [Amycolatopsis sp. Hca4]|uniref:urease accessory protein UreD n=1 Tax=Amycolatopsis sp. Hca4 TaxID=2742131 RepID=UPI00159155D8|nr:urease accessory protein UreD [Amycolatopsis sp. Hca4]QKV77924.1 urease accessory protein UreD [Amycolatopsis sp. Hca4]